MGVVSAADVGSEIGNMEPESIGDGSVFDGQHKRLVGEDSTYQGRHHARGLCLRCHWRHHR